MLVQLQKNFEDAGLLPRLVATLYVRAGQDAAHQYAVECGAFQVYNEQVADLLHPEHRNGKGQNLSVRKKDGHGQVDNLTWKACASAKELLDHFAYARKNVIYAETKMNKASSRSRMRASNCASRDGRRIPLREACRFVAWSI